MGIDTVLNSLRNKFLIYYSRKITVNTIFENYNEKLFLHKKNSLLAPYLPKVKEYILVVGFGTGVGFEFLGW